MLHGLKQGNEVLKEIHKEMNIESVEKLLDETAEARAYQQVCVHHPLGPTYPDSNILFTTGFQGIKG